MKAGYGPSLEYRLTGSEFSQPTNTLSEIYKDITTNNYTCQKLLRFGENILDANFENPNDSDGLEIYNIQRRIVIKTLAKQIRETSETIADYLLRRMNNEEKSPGDYAKLDEITKEAIVA